MGIPDEDVARVRAATDIVALIGEQAALKRQGRRWVGLCPFHQEKSASFSVNAEEGFYYCFGCQAKGDAITFLRETEHLDFVDAVRRLADRAGITIREEGGSSHERRRRSALMETMEAATAWYHERLLTGADAGRARDYLRSRGYGGDQVRHFRLGWAPDDWDVLCRALTLNRETAIDTGLGFVNRRGRLQDAFRGRILFPICDPSGHPVALGGRILPGSEDPAKYKNSQETAIYVKRKTLYALNWAKHGIVASGEVVVCEGYTDVIGMFDAGVDRAVATCGTALADEHVRLLRNFASRVVLAFDADGAGQAAAGRFYEWERTLDLDVAVASLPAGTDPGELARNDPEALRAAVEGARPFLRFRVDRILEAADLSTPEGRAKGAERALGAVAEHPDDLVRDQYLMTVAERCRLEPDALRPRLERLRREGPPPETTRGRGGERRGPARPGDRRTAGTGTDHDHDPGPASPSWDEESDGWGPPSDRGRPRPAATGDGPGLQALRLAIHRPEEVDDRLQPALFWDPVQRGAFEALVDHSELHEAIEEARPEESDLLVRLVVEEPSATYEDVIGLLLREASRRELARAGRASDATPEELARANQAARWLHELDDPEASGTAMDGLLAWLQQRSDPVERGWGR